MNAATIGETYTVDDTQWVSDHFQENYAMLFSIGRLFAGNTPEQLQLVDDAIQDVFVRLWQKRAKLREHPNIDAWLVEALRQQLRGQFSRHARRQKIAKLQYYDDPDEAQLGHLEQTTYPMPSDILEGKERYQLLVTLLGQENASIFYAYCVLNYSARELAVQYGVSECCIWTRISRSKRRILARPDLFFMIMLAFLLHV